MDDTTPSIPSSMPALESPLPRVAKLSAADLNEIATEQLAQPVSVAETVFELTARHPYDPAGRMDYFQPGRWDCTDDYISMYPITAELGIGDGTAGYVEYTAATTGAHLVAVRFNGYQTTLWASGPWGVATAYCATMQDTVTLTALWQANAAGDPLSFALSSRGGGGAVLRAIQVYALA